MRIRISEMLVVVSVFAFAFVALKRADETFEMLFINFALATILLSLIMAIGRAKAARAFWAGFFAASSLYFGFAQIPDNFQFSPRMESAEFTTVLLRKAGEKLHPNAFQDNGFGGFFSVGSDDDTDIRIQNDNLNPVAPADSAPDFTVVTSAFQGLGGVDRNAGFKDDPLIFMGIGHAAWALLFGWIVGHASQLVYERSRADG